jgi:anti-sigma factor ChrR (cupin superfamily)
MIKILSKFFPEKNDNYIKAINGLKNVKRKFDGFVISYPDVTPNEIMFVKEKWETLPKSISNGVKIMALSFVDDCKTLITKYEPNAYVTPHHHDEYEFGVVIKGELIDKFTGKHYQVGDEYSFSPRHVHYLSASKYGCMVYSSLTSNKNFHIEPLSEKLVSKLNLT